MGRDRRWLGVFGAAIGGAAGFLVRGHLNGGEVVRFGNISEQISKLFAWAGVGAALGTVVGVFIARAMPVRRRP
jgi:hypothetical protein